MSTRSYAAEVGWRSDGRQPDGAEQHRGFYHAAGLRWPGIAVQTAGRVVFFIHNPPLAFLEGTRWRACFAPYNGAWWRVNVVSRSGPELDGDLSSGIHAVNKVLQEIVRPKNWIRQ